MDLILLYVLPVLAVILSLVFVLISKASEGKEFSLLLAFSGAFLLALTIFELLPRVYTGGNIELVGLCIMGGILLQIVLEFFSKGAEHGHIHHSHTTALPWMLLISLGIHAFLEGMALVPGQSMVYGIVVHKIPVAVILAIFLLKTTKNTAIVWALMIAFSLMTPLGTAASLHIDILEAVKIPITAVVIGILLHISTVILFESSEDHKFNYGKLVVIFIGVLLAHFL